MNDPGKIDMSVEKIEMEPLMGEKHWDPCAECKLIGTAACDYCEMIGKELVT